MKEVKWSMVLTEEQKEKLATEAAEELKQLRGIRVVGLQSGQAVLLGAAEDRREKLFLLPGGTLWYQFPSTNNKQWFGYSVGDNADFKEIAKIFYLTLDQIRAIRLSLEQKSKKRGLTNG